MWSYEEEKTGPIGASFFNRGWVGPKHIGLESSWVGLSSWTKRSKNILALQNTCKASISLQSWSILSFSDEHNIQRHKLCIRWCSKLKQEPELWTQKLCFENIQMWYKVSEAELSWEPKQVKFSEIRCHSLSLPFVLNLLTYFYSCRNLTFLCCPSSE